MNGTLDVLLNVCGGVGDASVSEDIEAAFRDDENLVTDVMFPDKVTEKFLVNTGLIDDLYSRLDRVAVF